MELAVSILEGYKMAREIAIGERGIYGSDRIVYIFYRILDYFSFNQSIEFFVTSITAPGSEAQVQLV